MKKYAFASMMMLACLQWGCFSCPDDELELNVRGSHSAMHLMEERLFMVGTDEIISLDLTERPPLETDRKALDFIVVSSTQTASHLLLMGPDLSFTGCEVDEGGTLSAPENNLLSTLLGIQADSPRVSSGDLLFVASPSFTLSRASRIIVADISNLSSPTVLHEQFLETPAVDLALVGDRLFVLEANKLSLFTVSAVQAPTLIQSLPQMFSSSLAISDDLLMVTALDSLHQYRQTDTLIHLSTLPLD